jgi:eukaryotic-like serine/threonine-protein kinase
MPVPIKLVYSFASADEALREQLSAQLRPLVQQGFLSEWHEQLISPGAQVGQERQSAWRSADIILVLLSADYFSSAAYDDQEMQLALERHRFNQVLIVPILVRPCDWQSTPVGHLQCLPRSGTFVTQWDNRDEALLSVVQDLRHFITTRQSSGIPLTPVQRTNRQRLLKRVRTMWIDGLLEQSLRHAVWIDLHLQKQPDALERSWGLMVQELDRGPRPLPPGTSILQVFEEADEELLILGEPGSGKTTLLLYLARTLLDHADADENRRMPVVFNLSSWAQQRLPLDQWLIEELKVRYQVPQHVGRAWIDANRIFPLLDGLDEVAEPARIACVQAIATYTQRDLDRTPLILCCRTQEYQAFSTPPPISYAIMLLPFTDEQMEAYLSSVSGPIDALRQALREDEELFALAHRPLMLSIFTQAYQGEALADLPVATPQQGYPYALFRHYVRHMLTRRARVQHATEEQMYHWLTYFATQLYRQQQTMFAVEELQPTWLPERSRFWYRWSMPVVYALTFGLIFGPVFGLSFGIVYRFVSGSASGLVYGIVFGLFVGVMGGLIGGLIFGVTFKEHQTIRPAEITVWSWASAWHSMRIWTLGGLAVGTAAGVAGGFIAGPAGGIAVGLATVIVVGLVGGMVGGLPPMQIPEKFSSSPNEGIWRSGRRGLLFVLLAILLFGSAGGVIFGMFGTSIRDLAYGLIFGLVIGSVGGLIFGFAFGLIGGRTGLAAFLQHFTLRLFLWRLTLLPWDLVAFLDEATERLLLRKVGGSYIFVHRLLRDVLATQQHDG